MQVWHSRVLLFLCATSLFCGDNQQKSAGVNKPADAVTPASGAPPQLKRIRIPKVSRPPRLQDFIDNVPRQAEVELADFRQREPGDGTPASHSTKAYLSYDDRQLYVVFVCKEDPGHVRASLAKREDIGENDSVAIYLDTFHDRQRAYVFASNPLGVQRDSVVTEGGGNDARFDTLWSNEGRITRDGYVVWIAIPFKSLRFHNSDDQTWGIALSRSFVRNNERAYWPYITKRQAGFVRQFAEMEGLELVSAAHNIEVIPYLTGAHAVLSGGETPAYKVQNDKRAGVDVKTVIHDAFTFDATLNPDFAQVESDDPQVTINQRFEVFFPEKRPFFLENAGFFGTPINLFFSRRIIDPEFGGKLTGRAGPWTVGALVADDRAAGLALPGANPDFGRRAVDGVLRVQRDVGDQSRIGFFTSTRQLGSIWNRMISVDTRLKLNQNWFFTGQYARSYDRQPGGVKHDGLAAYADLTHSGRHFTYDASYADRSPDFRAPLGFIQRVDIRQGTQYAGYYWTPESSAVLSFGPGVSVSADWDRRGRLQDWYGNADFSIDFKGPTGFKVSRSEAFEFIDPYRLRYAKTGMSFYSDRWRTLSIYGSFEAGTAANYNPGPGLPLFTGGSKDASFGFAWRPVKQLRLEQFYFFDHLAAPSRFSFDPTLSRLPVYTSHLSRTKINYQFTRALSLRGILDYYGVLPNSALFYQDRFKQLSGDILFTYMLHPGTALYFGYNNRYENLAIDPEAPSHLRRWGAPDYMVNRQFFVKLSYSFRF